MVAGVHLIIIEELLIYSLLLGLGSAIPTWPGQAILGRPLRSLLVG